ncbi:MAG: 2-oxo acid dehydrogenase subunit E2 [Thaumarchaeota archaeon]|nr:2-oxo acid dehydrogenase subunit E2 [Nitrososphaerota archaeon]
MPTEVLMPKLGLTMTKGTIVRWFKNEGERVEKGEKLALFETEKVTTEITAPASGILLKILSPVKSSVPVGQPIAYVGVAGESIPLPAAQAQVQTATSAPAQVANAAQSPVASTAEIRATPKAKRLAAEKGADLAKVNGTGPGGMITEDDVERAILEAKSKTQMGLKVREIVPLSETRRVIGKRLNSSLQTMAQVTLVYEADASEMVKLRESRLPEIEAKAGVRLTYTDLLVKAVARALREFPMMNSALEEDGIKLIDEVNIGVAVATERGLIVPVVRDADTTDLLGVVTAMKDMASRGREGKLTLKEVTSGTFTITNLGMTAVDSFTPIINPPQVGILGVGRIVKKPVVVGDSIEIRSRITFSLTFDHRVVDGFTAAEFLRKVVEILEDGAKLSETAR